MRSKRQNYEKLPQGSFFVVCSERRKLSAWLPKGFEAVLPYLRRIPILSKWETGTGRVMVETRAARAK